MLSISCLLSLYGTDELMALAVRPCRGNVRVKEEQAKIVVQVQPNASENKVARFEGGVWHLRIAAPPIKGKANRELIGFLSDILGVSKSF